MEEHSAQSTNKMLHPTNTFPKVIIGIVLIVVIGGGGFFGGVQYQKGHGESTTAQTGGRGQFGANARGGGMRQRDGGIGTVSAITATSISLSDQRTNTTKTYTITSSTSITNNGVAVAYSTIAVGSQVFVRTSSATSTAATEILVNPSMGGGSNAQGDAGGGSIGT